MCGVDQGCSLAAYAYAMGTKKATLNILNRIQALDPQAKMLVYLDDGYIWVKKDILDAVGRIIADDLLRTTLRFSLPNSRSGFLMVHQWPRPGRIGRLKR